MKALIANFMNNIIVMSETHVAHTKPLSRKHSLSESFGGSKVTKLIFSNSGKRYCWIPTLTHSYHRSLLNWTCRLFFIIIVAWVALGKFLREFVYLAVEICHRRTLLSATPSFQVYIGKTLKIGKNIKDAVVLGWGRQILENSSQTIGITAVTVSPLSWTWSIWNTINLK